MVVLASASEVFILASIASEATTGNPLKKRSFRLVGVEVGNLAK